MIDAEHRRPLAAFCLVFAVACLIMGNGLRTQVVDVRIVAGAPPQVVTSIAPDMILGHVLTVVPKQVESSPASQQAVESSGHVTRSVEEPASPVTSSVAQAGPAAAAPVRDTKAHTKQPSQHVTRPRPPAPGVRPAAPPTPKPVPAEVIVPVAAPTPSTPTFTPPKQGSLDEPDHHDHWHHGHWHHGPGRGEHGDAESDKNTDGDRGDRDHGDRGDRGDHHGHSHDRGGSEHHH